METVISVGSGFGRATIAKGTRLKNLDPRHSAVVIVTYVGSEYVHYTSPKNGRDCMISINRLRKTWGHRNGYRLADGETPATVILP
jgi:hypothetical protein